MKHQVTPFIYNGHGLSTITDEQGEIWFVAKEVADILDYKDATELTKRLDSDDKQNLPVAGFGNRGVICINESGLYQATLESTKPEAKPFKKWVTSDVLPSIRKTGRYETPKAKEQTSLDKLRLANALEKGEVVAARLCSRFPSLGESSQRVIYAKIINPIMGDEVIMLPRVDERLLTAGKVGEEIGISANMVGRLANKHGMKTDEFGEFRLDKSAYSDKQVETFHYNAKAIAKLRDLSAGEGGAE